MRKWNTPLLIAVIAAAAQIVAALIQAVSRLQGVW